MSDLTYDNTIQIAFISYITYSNPHHQLEKYLYVYQNIINSIQIAVAAISSTPLTLIHSISLSILSDYSLAVLCCPRKQYFLPTKMPSQLMFNANNKCPAVYTPQPCNIMCAKAKIL